MVQLTTRERVDAFWSSTLGVDAAELHSPGVSVFPNPAHREDWRGVYVLSLHSSIDKGACIFAPADLVGSVAAALATQDPEIALDPHTWPPILGDAIRLTFGPAIHTYRDDPAGLGEYATGRRMNPDDSEALGQLRSAVDALEWRSAGFSAQPAVLFGIFEGDRLVAAANLTAGPDAATDIGIIIHPDGRGKGYGLQIAATAAQQAIAMHGVARFRVLATSQPTLAIARRLQFEEYGRNLAVHLV
jgi:hypothetical protein